MWLRSALGRHLGHRRGLPWSQESSPCDLTVQHRFKTWGRGFTLVTWQGWPRLALCKSEAVLPVRGCILTFGPQRGSHGALADLHVRGGGVTRCPEEFTKPENNSPSGRIPTARPTAVEGIVTQPEEPPPPTKDGFTWQIATAR